MPVLEADNDLAVLIAAAEAAGDVALRHFSGSRKAREKPGGQGPVTDADLEVDALLKDRLLAARPQHGWLSEETPDSPARLDRRAVFIVDPIDGTRAFVDGHRAWAHSIAAVTDGQVTAAVVYLPALERLYAACRGAGATINGRTIAVDPAADETGELLAARPNFEAKHWPGGVTPMRRAFRSSLANRLALVAEGRFSAMLSLRRVWEWDVAAGTLIAQEAGAQVSTHRGAGLQFNTPEAMQESILAAPQALHRKLASRLDPGAA